MTQSLVSFALVFTGISAYAHNGVHHAHSNAEQVKSAPESKSVFEAINQEYLQNVKSILQRSCFDCHSQNTKFPWYHSVPLIGGWMEGDVREAQTHLDFTFGFPFKGHGTPEEDLKAIRDVIADESMPPWRYRILHGETKMTKEERERIIAWTRASEEALHRSKP